jgi:hypothetical protein
MKIFSHSAKLSTLVLGVLTSIVFLSSCTKETTAPAGPRGPEGPAGASPVYGVGTFTVSTWTQSGASWIADIYVSQLTQNIVDYGTVQVFVQYGTEWWAMPDINGINSMQYGYKLGYVSLLNSNSNGSLPINPGTKVFKVVVISQMKKKENPNVSWNNYNEVKKVLNLKD